MAGPELPALDLCLLKDTSLCIFPLVKESSLGRCRQAVSGSHQKTFFDVARTRRCSRRCCSDSTSKCEARDAACFSSVGKMARCQKRAGRFLGREGKRVRPSVRIFEVGKHRVLPGSEVGKCWRPTGKPTCRLGGRAAVPRPQVNAWADHFGRRRPQDYHLCGQPPRAAHLQTPR